MTKQEAIEIVERYLSDRLKIKPDDEMHLFVDRMKEHDSCWEIPNYPKAYLGNTSVILAGSGPYLVDKENGKIYLTGSAPIDWVEDFEKMRTGQKATWRWDELKNHFLDVQFETLPERKLWTKTETVKYEEIYRFLEKTFKEFRSENPSNINPVIKRSKYNEFESTFVVYYPENSTVPDQLSLKHITLPEMSTISLNYSMNDHHSFFGPLNEIKDWLKVNPGYKATDHFWIEMDEKDLNLSFEFWNLKMTLELTPLP